MKNLFSELDAIQAEIDKPFLPFREAMREITAIDRAIQDVLNMNSVAILGDTYSQNDNIYHCPHLSITAPPVEAPRITDMSKKLEIIVDYFVYLIQQKCAEEGKEYTASTTVH